MTLSGGDGKGELGTFAWSPETVIVHYVTVTGCGLTDGVVSHTKHVTEEFNDYRSTLGLWTWWRFSADMEFISNI